jgi:hypothetical protein
VLFARIYRNIKNYLIQAQGFNESEMLILCDDGRSHAPTKKNIEDAFRRITEYSQAGDVVFVHVRWIRLGVPSFDVCPRLMTDASSHQLLM